jgi:hypothetical protein
MSTYRVATGHDVVLGSLTVLSPQPSGDAVIQTTRRTFSADGSVADQGRYIELNWSAYTSALVTVYVRDEVFTWVRMNGTAIRPEPGRQVRWGEVQSRPLGISILVRDLDAVPSPPVSVQDDATATDSVTVSVS